MTYSIMIKVLMDINTLFCYANCLDIVLNFLISCMVTHKVSLPMFSWERCSLPFDIIQILVITEVIMAKYFTDGNILNVQIITITPNSLLTIHI